MSDAYRRWSPSGTSASAIAAAVAACCIALAFAAPAAHAADPDPCRVAEAAVDALTPFDLAGDESGIGGTGHSGDESGIGGTGHSGDESGLGGTGYAGHSGDESGIGGTGVHDGEMAGIGVYGTLRAFGSICVNGLRVGYPDDAEVTRNGREASLADLAVGQVVWLQASRRSSQRGARYTTDRIHVYSALVGRIESIEGRARRIRIDDRTVRVPDLGDGGVALAFSALRIGTWVDVSGLPDRDGTIVASRLVADTSRRSFAGPALADLLEDARDLRSLSLEGYVQDRPAPDRLRVAGLELDVSGVRQRAAEVAPGRRIRATLRFESDGSWVVERPSGDAAVRPESSPDVDDLMASSESARVSTLDEAPEPSQVVDKVGAEVQPTSNLDTIERVDSIEQVEQVEQIEPIEPIERVVRPEVPERPDRVKPERFERVPRVDRIERPSRVDVRGK